MENRVNSEEYWNNRFVTDWEEMKGIEQTQFFAHMLCEALPDWFVRKIKEEKFSICDMGCACGDAVDVLAKFFDLDVAGCDFAEEAIHIAQKRYPEYHFSQIDMTSISDEFSFDILVCSNVLEHFSKPWVILNNLMNAANKYVVLMMPYKETLQISEHVYKFSDEKIPVKVNNFSLVFCDICDGREAKMTYYPGEQIILVYSREVSDLSVTTLGDINKPVLKLQNRLKDYVQQNLGLKNELVSEQQRYMELKDELNSERQKSIALEDGLNLEQQKSIALEHKLNSEQQKSTVLEEKLNLEHEKSTGLKNELISAQQEKDTLTREVSLAQEKVAELEKGIAETANKVEQEIAILKDENRKLQECIQQAKAECENIAQTKIQKISHLINRTKHQGLSGDRNEQKKYQRWIISKIKGNGGDLDHRFNQIFNVINILNVPTKKISNTVELTTSLSEENLTMGKKKILHEKYNKFDVIMLSVIDYDFRFQRPQHFATRFSYNGHRVFYINANHYNESSISEIEPNLYVINIHNSDFTAIHLTDWKNQFDELKENLDRIVNQYAVRDAVIVVDYPNWILGAEYLREKYGFKMITDYMDDFTGFLNPAEELVKKNCEDLLRSSDKIIASSQFLYDIAHKYNKTVEIVRNGTEYDMFQKAKGSIQHERKIIGYYGAVAEWFDIEKVTYLANSMPECDIVIIGNVTAGEEQLKKYSNINLLGEKPYKKLPQYLKCFDVCLIPFDTSTDLIKATNPVKFYEYLSAGKKIVATEIPELEPYRDQYVYMSNDNEIFLEYVRKCLNNQDSLINSVQCMQFAEKNDWQCRYEVFEQACRESTPQISIIVLTYNNLELNKLCISSIVEKTAYPNYELIIVDNCSTDGTREYLTKIEKEYSQIRLILSDENKGFAGGNNLGMLQAKGEYVVLLNNDTIVTRGWLTAMRKHFDHDEKLGLCGSVTNSIGNEAKIPVEYHTVEEMHQFAYQYTTAHINEEYRDVRVLALFCTMIKKEVIQKCGMLDEAYRIGMFEDDDYSEAVKQKGFTITVAEDVFIHHFAGASFKKLEDEVYRKIFEENKTIFEKKWGTKWIMHKARAGVEWDTNADIDLLK